MKADEKKDLKALVATIYADGYADSIAQLARDFDLEEHIQSAGEAMPAAVGHRMDIIDKSLLLYVGMIRERASALRELGRTAEEIHADVHAFAQRLADERADLITRTEYATGRNEGAKAILEPSGLEYEWRFPHMELGRPGHEECDICAEIRDGAPYSRDQAEEMGFPDLPHLQCDHAWVIVPKGQRARTEEFPSL